MVGLTECRVHLVRPIGDANCIRRIHCTIQHANLIHNGSLQERIFLHQSHSLVKLVLPALVSISTSRQAIIGVEVPTNVCGAPARNVLAFGTSMMEEAVDVVQVHCNKWCGQILVALGNRSCGSLLPLTDLDGSTLGVGPAIRQRLLVINSVHWPVTTSSGMAVTPAITMSSRVWCRCALLTEKM